MHTPDSAFVKAILRVSFVFKRLIAAVLALLMFAVIALVTAEIALAFVRFVLPGQSVPYTEMVMSEQEMLSILGLFLSVLVALELIETVEVYFKKNSIHVEIVVLVAIIALARKVVILDLNKYEPFLVFALGFLVLALGGTYFVVRRAAPPDS